MAITGLTARDALGLTLVVPHGCHEAAAAFYIDAFGATSPRHWIHPKTGEVAGIDITIGQATFTVCSANPRREADPNLPGPCAVPPPGRGSTIFQICVDDLEATLERALKLGATLHTPIQDADWGDRVATIVDPFGHIWSLAAIQNWMSVPDYNARGNIQLIEAA
jgi:PhnB protein